MEKFKEYFNRKLNENKEFTSINAYTVNNDTDKWVLIVDNKFGFFNTQAEANMAWSAIGGESDEDLGDTPFGSAELLPPNYPKKQNRTELDGITQHFVSEYKPINIRDYILKTIDRSYAKYQKKLLNTHLSPKEKLDNQKQVDSMWNWLTKG